MFLSHEVLGELECFPSLATTSCLGTTQMKRDLVIKFVFTVSTFDSCTF